MIAYNSTGNGGPAIEPAMFGIPYTNLQPGIMAHLPEWITTNCGKDAVTVFDRLLIDKEFYETKSFAYREYIKKTHTFAAFNINLNNKLREKGLL